MKKILIASLSISLIISCLLGCKNTNEVVNIEQDEKNKKVI